MPRCKIYPLVGGPFDGGTIPAMPEDQSITYLPHRSDFKRRRLESHHAIYIRKGDEFVFAGIKSDRNSD